jgi:hypothetical protein
MVLFKYSEHRQNACKKELDVAGWWAKEDWHRDG